ncbi:MAG: non-ribosomal peptide synthetase [Clostridia bacterium]|jgi:long-subunit acyl-CoA synthetase (AMP-forming)/acyl carrier protein|nr:non-ribosomal peptide synthetase [Clostridia bacterium]MBT7121882.1 non-ribosomal peptide synthetase [Clostridia bacterium]
MHAYSDVLERLSKDYSYKCMYDIICDNKARTAAQFSDENNQTCTITYSDYEQRIELAARTLSKALQGQTGLYVGLLCASSHNWPTLFWAILKSGNNALFLGANESNKTTQHLLSEAGAYALISDNDTQLKNVLCLSSADLLNTDSDFALPAVFGDKIALCTSGTTGSSRVFVYDGKAMGHQIYSAKGFIPLNRDLIYKNNGGPLKVLVCLPFSHIFGFVANYMWNACAGKTLVYPPDMSPDTILHTCRVFKITHVFCVPLFWNNIASGVMKKVKQADKKSQDKFDKMCALSIRLQKAMPHLGRKIVTTFIFKKIQQKLLGTSIRFLISGGGHILPETLRIINALGYPLYNGFGMTEVGVTSVELSHDIAKRLLGRVGKPFDTVEYKIDSKKEGRDGELLVRGTSLHSGQIVKGKYIVRTEEWFATGDVGNLNADGLYIDGRVKEVIVGESGINVYPDVVEDSFTGLPSVEQYSVLGLVTGNPYEEIALVIEFAKDAGSLDIRKTALTINAVNQKLPLEKKVKIVLVSQEKLPLISGIKVQRGRLKQAIEDGSHPYSILDLAKRNLISKQYTDVAKVLERDERFAELKEQMRGIFADVLFLDPADISDHDLFFDDLSGDSLSVIGLAARIEDSLSVIISLPELSTMPDINVFQLTELTYRRKFNPEPATISETVSADE